MVYQAVKRPIGNGAARVQRKFSILTRLYDELNVKKTGKYKDDPDWSGWLTTWEIAKSIGLVPSGHLRGMLAELAFEGVVTSSVKEWRSNVHSRMWRLVDGAENSDGWARAFDAYLHGLDALRGEK